MEARYLTDTHGPEEEAAAPTPATASTPGAGPPPDRPAPYAGFSMRPAMIVVGLAALILLGFVAIGLATNGAPARTDTSRSIQIVSGSSLRAVRAAPALSVITRSGEPPSNILNAVSLPEGSTRVSHQINSASADQFDAQIGLLSDASQGAIRTFYLSDMKAQGWQIQGTGPARNDPGAFEVLGRKAGSDGFFWQMGAVVSATTFGPHAPPAGQTDFTVRLFQVPDPD